MGKKKTKWLLIKSVNKGVWVDINDVLDIVAIPAQQSIINGVLQQRKNLYAIVFEDGTRWQPLELENHTIDRFNKYKKRKVRKND